MRIKIDSLDKLFSKYIRLRAIKTVHGCERCLTGKQDYKGLQCSHFFGRSKRSTRYDEDNAVGLCFGCHQYLGSHPLEHVEWFKQRLGERFDLLQARAGIPGKPDRELLTIYLKAKIKELENNISTKC